MERVSDEYDRPLVEASRSALVELAYCLGAYKDALVLVGGWVPYFLLRDHQPSDVPFEHVGSIDIDIVVDPDRVGASEYASIEEIITGRDWTHLEDRPFSFIRTVTSAIDGDEKDIKVDFLTTQPDRLIGRNRDREVQPDLIARPFRAAPIALDHNSEVTVDGQLPGGGVIRRNLVMADIVGCIGMKGHALDGRYKEKDAYDIVAVVENYGEGPKEVAGLIRPHVKEPLVAESLGYIGEFFSSPLAAGPRFVGDFHATELGEARQRRIQRSYQVVHALLEAL